MSSQLYPDSFTRQQMNENLDRRVKHFRKVGTHHVYTGETMKRRVKESMRARAERLTEEKGLLKVAASTPQVKGVFSKMKSKVSNFLKSFLKF